MLDIELIYNAPYSPEYNPIENVFSKVKNIYKNRKLQALVRDEQWEMKVEIEYAFRQVTI